LAAFLYHVFCSFLIFFYINIAVFHPDAIKVFFCLYAKTTPTG
jgi:hypothetical protein